MNVFFETLFLIVIPVGLLVLNVIPLNLRGGVLGVVVLITLVLAFIQKLSPKNDLGIRTDNFKKSLLPYAVFTIIGIVSLFVLASLLNKHVLPQWWTYPHLQWAFLPISVAQEFVFRAFLQTKIQRVINPFLAIFIIALMYSGIHLLWKDPLIMGMTFVAGLGWGYLWYKYPNFYLLSISHTILNFLAIYLGFFPWLVTDFYK